MSSTGCALSKPGVISTMGISLFAGIGSEYAMTFFDSNTGDENGHGLSGHFIKRYEGWVSHHGATKGEPDS